jgi:trans-aconitate methyltransferase
MAEITNYDVYTARMRQSMYDKMFFVDKIFDESITTLIDFGCGDGELIRHLREFMPNIRFIGFDNNSTMLERAKQNAPFAEYYSRWEDIHVNPSTTILNMSSVLHEVYTYSNDQELMSFWRKVACGRWAYITIRDMFKNPDNKMIGNAWRKRVRERGYASQMDDFEKVWGPITHLNQAIHFLLKYRYSENWDREVAEDYMPLTPNELYKHLPDYRVCWSNFSGLPYIANQVSKDFDVDISEVPTHLRVILQRKTVNAHAK